MFGNDEYDCWPMDDNPPSDLTCPFCMEKDFDRIGLKIHLLSGHCEIFNSVDHIVRRNAMEETQLFSSLESLEKSHPNIFR